MQSLTPEEKKVKIVTGEGQETFVPETVAADDGALKRLLASFYGTDNFRIERKQEGGETVIHVVKLAGAKGGAAAPLKVLKKRRGGQNPVIVLYRELAEVDLMAPQAEESVRIQKRVERALEQGHRLRDRVVSARGRLRQAAGIPSPVAIPGF
jgi:hypothetical protein